MPAVRNIVVSLYLALAVVAMGGHGPVLARAEAPPAPAYRTLGDANKAGINPAREAPGHTAPHITVEVVSPPVSQVEQSGGHRMVTGALGLVLFAGGLLWWHRSR